MQNFELKDGIITLSLIVFTSLLSLQTMKNDSVKYRYMFNAYAIRHRGEWWRFFTHGVLHADFQHLLFNMISLAFFGFTAERAFSIYYPVAGKFLYLLMYIMGLASSSLYSYTKHKNNTMYYALGASGAVASVMFSSILFAPMSPVGLMFVPGRVPAWVFGIIYLVISSIMARRNTDNIGHDAHFWGGVFGLIYTAVLAPAAFYGFLSAISGS